MGQVEVKTTRDLKLFINNDIRNIKKDIVSKLAKHSKNFVKENAPQMKAHVRFHPNGFKIGEPIDRDDPDGRKANELERETKTYANLYRKLSDENYVKNLLEKG